MRRNQIFCYTRGPQLPWDPVVCVSRLIALGFLMMDGVEAWSCRREIPSD